MQSWQLCLPLSSKLLSSPASKLLCVPLLLLHSSKPSQKASFTPGPHCLVCCGKRDQALCDSAGHDHKQILSDFASPARIACAIQEDTCQEWRQNSCLTSEPPQRFQEHSPFVLSFGSTHRMHLQMAVLVFDIHKRSGAESVPLHFDAQSFATKSWWNHCASWRNCHLSDPHFFQSTAFDPLHFRLPLSKWLEKCFCGLVLPGCMTKHLHFSRLLPNHCDNV